MLSEKTFVVLGEIGREQQKRIYWQVTKIDHPDDRAIIRYQLIYSQDPRLDIFKWSEILYLQCLISKVTEI